MIKYLFKIKVIDDVNEIGNPNFFAARFQILGMVLTKYFLNVVK